MARWELLFNVFCEFGLKEAKESVMNLGKFTGGGQDLQKNEIGANEGMGEDSLQSQLASHA